MQLGIALKAMPETQLYIHHVIIIHANNFWYHHRDQDKNNYSLARTKHLQYDGSS